MSNSLRSEGLYCTYFRHKSCLAYPGCLTPCGVKAYIARRQGDFVGLPSDVSNSLRSEGLYCAVDQTVAQAFGVCLTPCGVKAYIAAATPASACD